MSDERGRWFRVYARQIRQHPKFHDLSAVELGAWLALRAECELRDSAVLTDRADALLVLRRRKVGRAGAVLDRLLSLHLFDVGEDSTLTVHDRADHDRQKYPSDEPPQTAERKRKSREVTTRDMNGHDTHARVQPQHADLANSIQQAAPAGLPGEDDSATFACRLFLDGGKWLSNRDYTKAWDDMDRRYTPEWVRSEIQPSFAAILASHDRVRPWDLKRMVELHCAERVRAADKERAAEVEHFGERETEALRARAAAASPEEVERATLIRKAVGLWTRERPDDPVPDNFEELAAWLSEHEPPAKGAVA